MSINTHGQAPVISLPSVENLHVAIVTASWNSQITHRLRDSALREFANAGLSSPGDIDCYDVPGTVELTFAASQLIETGLYDAVIVFGCVVRGGTPHFDYVCQSVTQGITHLNAECDTPVIFGVLTVDTEEDAMVRCDGTVADKGAEAAQAAIAMADFARKVKDL